MDHDWSDWWRCDVGEVAEVLRKGRPAHPPRPVATDDRKCPNLKSVRIVLRQNGVAASFYFFDIPHDLANNG